MIRPVNVAWFQSNWLGAIRKMCHGPMHTHAIMHSFCKLEISRAWLAFGRYWGWRDLLEEFKGRTIGTWWPSTRKRFADGTTRAETSDQNQKTFEVYPKCSGDNLRQLCFFANYLVSCYFIWNPSFSTPGFYQTRVSIPCRAIAGSLGLSLDTRRRWNHDARPMRDKGYSTRWEGTSGSWEPEMHTVFF